MISQIVIRESIGCGSRLVLLVDQDSIALMDIVAKQHQNTFYSK